MNENTPLIVHLASSFWWLIGSLIFFIILLDIVLVRILNLSKVNWKRIDYIWLAFALLGLLSASSDARRLYATNILEWQKTVAENNYKYLLLQVESGTKTALCSPAIRSQYSPNNFDEIEKERQIACEYFKSLSNALPKNINVNYEQINLPINRPKVSDEIVSEYFTDLDESLEIYNLSQKQIEKTKKTQAKTLIEIEASFLGPFLLAFALALRFTKVTGEVKLEKESENKN